MKPPTEECAAGPPTGISPLLSARSARADAAREASGRRRGVDPTADDRDYSAAECEFLRAMEAYKRSSGRLFPTWSEALEVLRGIGYHRAGDAGPAVAAAR